MPPPAARWRMASADSGIAPQTAIELGVSLADDAEQQRLNRAGAGIDRPTNVLAFPAWEPGAPIPPGAPLLLGDVVLAFETVAREAQQQGKPLADHLAPSRRARRAASASAMITPSDGRSGRDGGAAKPLYWPSLGVPDPYRGTM